MAQNEYIAGVCNIGPAEMTVRRKLGWRSMAVVVMLDGIFIWIRVNPWWRLLVFFPATMSASGFLQAYFHFCSGFGRRGLFNFGSLRNIQKITDEESKSKDNKKGRQITLYAALIGIVVAIVSVLL